jgi:hypothetical protein
MSDENKKPGSLQDIFQQMEPKQDVPDDLRKQVFSTVESVSVLSDIIDLFTIKWIQTESELWNTILENEYWNEEEKLFEYYQQKYKS